MMKFVFNLFLISEIYDVDESSTSKAGNWSDRVVKKPPNRTRIATHCNCQEYFRKNSLGVGGSELELLILIALG